MCFVLQVLKCWGAIVPENCFVSQQSIPFSLCYLSGIHIPPMHTSDANINIQKIGRIQTQYTEVFKITSNFNAWGGTQLSFWCRCAAQRAEQRGLWTDHYQIWDHCELNFLIKCSLVKWSLAQFEALELNSANFEAFELIFFLNLQFWDGSRVLRTGKNAEMGSCERQGGLEKGGLRGHTYPYLMFQVVLPGFYGTELAKNREVAKLWCPNEQKCLQK